MVLYSESCSFSTRRHLTRERRMEGSREGGGGGGGAERVAGSDGGRDRGREAGRQGGREAGRARGHLRRRSDSSSYRVCNGAHPSHSSTLHFRNIASVWSLPEMSSVRHDVDEITCGRATHAGFSLPVAPQMFRFRGDSLSRAHSLAIRHVRHGSVSPLGRCYFGWMSYFFRLLWVASNCSCHFATRASAGLHRRGWEVETKLLRECRRLFTGWW